MQVNRSSISSSPVAIFVSKIYRYASSFISPGHAFRSVSRDLGDGDIVTLKVVRRARAYRPKWAIPVLVAQIVSLLVLVLAAVLWGQDDWWMYLFAVSPAICMSAFVLVSTRRQVGKALFVVATLSAALLFLVFYQGAAMYWDQVRQGEQWPGSLIGLVWFSATAALVSAGWIVAMHVSSARGNPDKDVSDIEAERWANTYSHWYGIPGVSLRNFDSDAAGVGIAGEMVTARMLANLKRRIPSMIVLNSVPWPGRDHADIDHVVLIGNCLVVIDSKNWVGDFQFHYQDGVEYVYRDGAEFLDGRVHMGEQLYAVTDVVFAQTAERPISFGFLCLTDDRSSYTGRLSDELGLSVQPQTLGELHGYLVTIAEFRREDGECYGDVIDPVFASALTTLLRPGAPERRLTDREIEQFARGELTL